MHNILYANISYNQFILKIENTLAECAEIRKSNSQLKEEKHLLNEKLRLSADSIDNLQGWSKLIGLLHFPLILIPI